MLTARGKATSIGFFFKCIFLGTLWLWHTWVENVEFWWYCGEEVILWFWTFRMGLLSWQWENEFARPDFPFPWPQQGCAHKSGERCICPTAKLGMAGSFFGFLNRTKQAMCDGAGLPPLAFPWEAFLLVSVWGRLWSDGQGVTHTRLGLFRGPLYDKTASPTRRWLLAYMKQPASRFFFWISKEHLFLINYLNVPGKCGKIMKITCIPTVKLPSWKLI